MLKKILISLLFIASSVIAAEINWAKDYKSGVAQATKEKKPMFFIMSKTTCPPCIRLKNTTFKDKKVIEKLNKEFVAVIAYVDKGDHIPDILYAPYTPSLWFLQSNGEPRYEPLVGGVSAKSFLQALDIVKKDFDKEKN